MSKWRARLLYGYTGLALVLGLWTPIMWFISAARAHYGMSMFEILLMDPFVIFLFLVLCAATLVAQFGFIVMAHDMARYERKESEERENRYVDF